MKSSPIKPNKFINNLSNDILNQNHHLKTQIIKIRKTLKNYEEKMINQFIKIADQLNIEKPGFIFQSPEECLEYFIKIIDQNVGKNRVIGRQIQTIEIQLKKLYQQNQIYSKQHAQIKQQNIKKQEKILLLQQNCKGLTQTVSQLKKKMIQTQIKMTQQIKILSQVSIRKEKQMQIKHLQQKKEISEKSNKQIILYRLQIQDELSKKQKAMKLQIDKKDLEVKSLLQSINVFIQKNQKQQSAIKYKLKQRTKTEYKHSIEPSKIQGKASQSNIQVKSVQDNVPIESDNSIQILKSVIKPFSQHTALLQKVSELRKENMQMKSDLRKSNTMIIGLQSSLTEKTHELNLLISKMEILKMQYQKAKNQLSETAQLLEKSEQQKKDMDHYYDQKWNSQFNKVKFNLQNRYEDKRHQLQQQYELIKIQIQNERHQNLQQIELLNKKNQRLISENQSLVFQYKIIEAQREKQLTKFQQLKQAFKQHQKMQGEEIFTIHMQYDQKFKSALQKLKNNKNQILKLQNQIDQASLAQTKLICLLKQQYEEKIKRKTEQIKLYFEQIIQDHMEHINRLAVEIQSHKIVIQQNQRQRSQQIQEIKEKMNQQKQKQLRQLKLKNYDEVYKIKQKLVHNQNILKDVKHNMNQKLQHLEKQKQQKLAIISKKQEFIKQLQYRVKSDEEQKKKLQRYISKCIQSIKNLELKLESLNVENNSLKCIISDNQNNIKQLINQKNQWKYELQECRKQFYKGFKQLKETHEKKLQHYKSKVWELQTSNENRGISKQNFEMIKKLTEEKKQLQTQIALKQAQNLILNQVKQYYEIKSKDLDSKMILDYQLKQQKQAVLVRKPQRRNIDYSKFKSKVSQDLKGFTGRQSYEIKQLKSTFRMNTKSTPKIQKIQQIERKQFKRENHIKTRVNSSMM